MHHILEEIEQVFTTEDPVYYLFSILLTILSGYLRIFDSDIADQTCEMILLHGLDPGCELMSTPGERLSVLDSM